MNFANLHMHSIYSDGNFTPLQLVSIAKAMGYSAIALTDHETDGGFAEIAEACREEGMECLIGCEFYGSDFGQNFHIVGLDYDKDNKDIRALIKDRIDSRTEYTRKAFEYGKSIGAIHDITWNEVLDDCTDTTWICNAQVLITMRKKGLISKADRGGELSKLVFNAPEVKPYAPKAIAAEKVIKTIRSASGIAIIAHPEKWMDHVPALVGYGINGIEISHPQLSETTIARATQAAKEFGLYLSGGTDHYGALSGIGGKYATPVYSGISEEDYYIIKERKLG